MIIILQLLPSSVPCGTSGVTCSKAVTVKVGTGAHQERIKMRKGREVERRAWCGEQLANLNIQVKLRPRHKRISLRQLGHSVAIEVTWQPPPAQRDSLSLRWLILVLWSPGIEGTGSPSDCGLSGQTGWEEEVKMPPGLNQRLQVTGLCGNFNNDGADDQRAPSGLIHPSAALFGDSWRLHSYCPRAVPVQDTCSIYSHRKHWAIKKCSILKSDVFQPCHTEVYLLDQHLTTAKVIKIALFQVPVSPYLSQCVTDTCGCNVSSPPPTQPSLLIQCCWGRLKEPS